MDHAHRGEAALKASDYASAVTHYSLAIAASPESPTYYVKRSQAYQRTSKIPEALADAEVAVVLAVKRAKRELIAQAQLRRGIALFQLGQYGNALHVFGLAKKYDEKEKTVGIWEAKCNSKIKTLEEGDDAGKSTVSDVPDVKVPDPKVLKEGNPAAAASTQAVPNTTVSLAAKESTKPASPSTPVQTPPSKITHQWYQNNDFVNLSLMAKGVPRDRAVVEVHDHSLSISFPTATGSTYDFSIDPLFAGVDPAGSSSAVLSTKIDVKLKKAAPGQKWPALEGTGAAGTGDTSSSTKTVASRPAPTQVAPAYPTSSRSGPKNWDKIADSFRRPQDSKHHHHHHHHHNNNNNTTKDGHGASDAGDDVGKAAGAGGEKLDDNNDDGDGDGDSIYIDDNDDDGGDPANAFFKKLYAGADPDTRRAMMKSYQESNGTALSTNWAEVKKKRVETTPPDGMEARQWGE